MRSLRARLILSHILPILLVIPLIALAIYLIFLTQNNLASAEADIEEETARLVEQATLLASSTGQIESLWADPEVAQRFVTDIDLTLTSITMFGTQGRVLASSPSADQENIAMLLQSDELASVLAGKRMMELHIEEQPATRTTNVIIPVFDVKQRLTGALLLTQELQNAQQAITRMTRLIIGATMLLLLFGVALGLYLAFRLENSLQRVTHTVMEIAGGQTPASLPEAQTTEVNQLYQAVNALARRLNELEDSRRRMLANLVHEIGRPLGSLRAAIHALTHGADQDPALRGELLAGMDAQIERMQPLLDDLTQLHGQVLGSLELNRQPIALSPWLREVATLWQATAEKKGIRWRADIPLDLPTARIDADQMSRAVGNLLSNAIKFTPVRDDSESRVQLAAGVDDHDHPTAAWVRVTDTGLGIAPQDQERIFEAFIRAETGRRFPQGMGLGLAIAHDIVQAHDGEVSVVSELGHGAAFTIRFPLA